MLYDIKRESSQYVIQNSIRGNIKVLIDIMYTIVQCISPSFLAHFAFGGLAWGNYAIVF